MQAVLKANIDDNSGSASAAGFISCCEYFQQQAKQYPNKTAIVFMDESITYNELNNRANQLAHSLMSFQIEKGSIIAILQKRSINTIVSMLAILKIGCAFLLIDAAFPKKRVELILNDSKASVLLVDSETHNTVYKGIFIDNIVLYNVNEKIFSSQEKKNIDISVEADDLAYVIYTSGTTGKPKGVLIEHQGMINTLLNSIDIFGINSDDRIMSVLSFAFDGSIWDVFGTLLVGATLYLTNEKERLSIKKISTSINHNQISVAMFTPSLLRLLPASALANMRILISAGEACTFDLIKKAAPTCKFFNAYGPTEVSIFATIGICSNNDTMIGIGEPLKNVEIYVLDKHLQPTAIDEIGTLYIGGVGLAKGYLNNPEYTQTKFIKNPWSIGSSSRLYNSGDLVCRHANGIIEYIGRTDEEIKVCGNRVNFNDIKLALLRHPCVTNCIIKKAQLGHRKRIIAIIETYDNTITLKHIRQYLSEYLPKYMLPHQLINVKRLPLSFCSKVQTTDEVIKKILDAHTIVT